MQHLYVLPLSIVGTYFVHRLLQRIFGATSNAKAILSKVPGPPSSSWLKGHMPQLFDSKNGPRFHDSLIYDYDRVVKVEGFLGDKQLYISDPVALQSIIKDQDTFEETRVFIENNKIIFGEGLVATIGEHHKRQRKLVTPAFSVPRIRGMVPAFYDVAYRLRDALTKATDAARKQDIGCSDGPDKQSEVDISEWLSRVTLESIGVAGLGYSFDPLDSPSNNPYTKAIRSLIPLMFQIALLRLLTPFVTRLGSPSFRRLLLNLVPIQAVQKLKDMSDTMEKTCKDILREKRQGREAESEDDSGDGKDIMSLLLRANEIAKEGDRLSEAELLGQMNVLIFGAQDTTSSALSRILYLLSRRENMHLQWRLREEIIRAQKESNGDELSYDALSNLPFLDALLKETLRLYPPVPFVRRISRRDTILPLSRPLTLINGQTVSEIPIPEGTNIWVSISGANRLKEIWGEDAADWKPERWLRGGTNDDPKLESVDRIDMGKTRLPGVYAGMLTFFGGGRSCIGYRFALTEMKIVLCTLISTFEFNETESNIVWNLSQILSPSVRSKDANGTVVDRQGLPVKLRALEG